MVLRGLFFVLLVLISSLLGVTFFHSFLLLLLFLSPCLHRCLVDAIIASWLVFCSALLECFLGMRVVISGDEIRSNEASLLLMNHRTRLDWMYLWSVLLRQSGVKMEKIILKTPLKLIPGAGWAMQVGGFLFINRKWEEDKLILDKMLDYYADLNHKTQILLFPEGTDLTERTLSYSDRFAAKNGLQPYKFCLHPRTTGFVHLVQQMQCNKHLDAIYDISIAYPDTFPQNEPDLILGEFPSEVHFHIKRHEASSLPSSPDDLAAWCAAIWRQKEEVLKNFAQTKRFTDEPSSPDRGPRFLFYATMVSWLVSVWAISWLLWSSSLAFWLAALQVAFFVYMGHFYGGFELFQADYYNRFFNRKKHS
ncbi:hypothetical protein CAPTEDRAFT_172905 [Capitella teleta]|uniref:Phospholipid/glycerol acyltransferase domain-containing protein n=1 Tax=Capitella teleta TaxID=283909 RepID=R7VLU9_CAPTE|nr:hypothetical protein CAPTEDRAFT_172905 [Capitella teleta]|eukprot:ELU17930.1 hypothetical protein CAPTEDRAFT_172905 [Capitella teleta]